MDNQQVQESRKGFSKSYEAVTKIIEALEGLGLRDKAWCLGYAIGVSGIANNEEARAIVNFTTAMATELKLSREKKDATGGGDKD